MKSIAHKFVGFGLFVVVLTSCQEFQRPEVVKKVPICINLTNGVSACKDHTGEYDLDSEGLIATTPEGYATMEKYIDQLEARLKACFRSKKKCR